jgi:RimJ/RimL family protein N-acetyltransferase
VAIRLVPITEAGIAAEAIELPPPASEILPVTAAMYQSSGFAPPWIAYLAVHDGSTVGTCAFKSAPVNGRVEIAYFTFPDFEGRGIATEMARRLIAIALAERPGIVVTAQTLPVRNSSNRILESLGFTLAGHAVDAEVGDVWEWQLSWGG